MMKNYKEIIINVLIDLGIDCSEINLNSDTDVDLSEYITNSLTFINFIVKIEEKLEIKIPDEFLILEKLTSLNGFINMLQSIDTNN